MTGLKIARLQANLTVSAQPRAEDFPALAAQGVAMVINNRPDGEEAGQLSAAEGAALAAENGMAYRHVPIRLPELSQADVDAFAAAQEAATGPVHAHCRSGLRSASLWAIAEVQAGRLSQDALQRSIAAAGLDPKPALAWLAAHPDSPAR